MVKWSVNQNQPRHSCRHKLESAGKWKGEPKWDEGVDVCEKEEGRNERYFVLDV